MKCEFCAWEMSPESIPPMKRHIEANHPDLEEFVAVWRDGELVVAREKKDTDVAIHIEIYHPIDKNGVEIIEIDSGDQERDSLAENAVNEDLEEVI